MTTTTVINFKRSAFGVKTKHHRLVIVIFSFYTCLHNFIPTEIKLYTKTNEFFELINFTWIKFRAHTIVGARTSTLYDAINTISKNTHSDFFPIWTVAWFNFIANTSERLEVSLVFSTIVGAEILTSIVILPR